MRFIAAILFLLVGSLLGIYALTGFTVSLTRLAGWVSAGDWSRITKVILAIAVSGTLAWYSLRAGWRRKKDIRIDLTALRGSEIRLTLAAVLALMSGALIVAALIVAFAVNPIDLPDHIGGDFLPWDPTRTARKYLLFAALAIGGAYLVFRYLRWQMSMSLLPAMLLTLAVPIGAAGYESVADRWSFAYWYASSNELASLRRDPYVHLQNPDGESSFVVRIRPDVLEGLQFLRATGASGDWSGLEELESEADLRRQVGWSLLIAFFLLVVTSGWLVYKDRDNLIEVRH